MRAILKDIALISWIGENSKVQMIMNFQCLYEVVACIRAGIITYSDPDPVVSLNLQILRGFTPQTAISESDSEVKNPTS
jgi:hypothetical protein